MHRLGGQKSGASVAFSAALLLLVVPARGADEALLIGGGPDADSSEISLEHNIRLFSQSLPALGMQTAQPRILFGGGPEGGVDVCFRDDAPVPPAYELMSALTDEGAETLNLRRHELPRVEAAADKESILAAVRDAGRRLGPGDRFLLYFSGHGGKGSPPSNGTMKTWGKEALSVRELAAALDEFDPDVQVLLVMVHCYGGAFANVLFQGGETARGLAPHRRAGVFATVENRPAAGCTTDTKVEDYREYTTYFLSALTGRDRLGKSVPAADIDKDGKISLEEAHAHVLVHSDTIDVPMRTTDRFLASLVRIDPRDASAIRASRDYSRLLEAAGPVDRWVLEELSRDLSLGGEGRIGEAARRARRLESQRRADRSELDRLRDARNEMAGRIRDVLFEEWPQLKRAWNPATHRLLDREGERIVARAKASPDYLEWTKARKRIASVKAKDAANERLWAKYRRLVSLADSVALADALQRGGPSDLRRRYEELRRLERWNVPGPAGGTALAR